MSKKWDNRLTDDESAEAERTYGSDLKRDSKRVPKAVRKQIKVKRRHQYDEM